MVYKNVLCGLISLSLALPAFGSSQNQTYMRCASFADNRGLVEKQFPFTKDWNWNKIFARSVLGFRSSSEEHLGVDLRKQNDMTKALLSSFVRNTSGENRAWMSETLSICAKLQEDH